MNSDYGKFAQTPQPMIDSKPQRMFSERDFKEILPTKLRIIEVAQPDLDIADLLLDMGYRNYLGLARRPEIISDLDTGSRLRPHLANFGSKEEVTRNNADVLIVPGELAGCLFDMKQLRHFRYLILRHGGTAGNFLARLMWIYRKRRGFRNEFQFSYRDSSGHIRRFLLAELPTYSLPQRYFISPALGIRGLSEILEHDKILHAILNNPNDLVSSSLKNQEVNILISDQEVERVRSLCVNEPGTIPVNLYSCTGLPGSNYHGSPYYPPTKSTEILERRRLLSGIFSVPSPRDHFLGQAYHAVYHLGPRSGLPGNGYRSDLSMKDGEKNNLLEYLTVLASNLKIDVRIDLFDLHEYLQGAGWSPSQRTLERVAPNNPFAANLIKDSMVRFDRGELFTLVLPEYAVSKDIHIRIEELLFRLGFEIVVSRPLTLVQREIAETLSVDWAWNLASTSADVGGPAYIIVAFDYNPRTLKKLNNQYPRVRNKHFFHKDRIRGILLSENLIHPHSYVLHMTQCDDEAWEYVRAILPQEVAGIKRDIQKRWNKYQTREVVLRTLPNHGSHSKVEVIEFNREKAVKKTFKPGYESFLEREIFALGEFGAENSMIPPLLDAGENYFIMPYYEDAFNYVERKTKKIPRSLAAKATEVLEFFYSHEYALIDFHPKHIILDPKKGVKVVDFEHLYKYESVPPSFAQSYDVAGIPIDFEKKDEWPTPTTTFNAHWKPFVCSDAMWPVYELLGQLTEWTSGVIRYSIKERIRRLAVSLYRELLNPRPWNRE